MKKILNRILRIHWKTWLMLSRLCIGYQISWRVTILENKKYRNWLISVASFCNQSNIMTCETKLWRKLGKILKLQRNTFMRTMWKSKRYLWSYLTSKCQNGLSKRYNSHISSSTFRNSPSGSPILNPKSRTCRKGVWTSMEVRLPTTWLQWLVRNYRFSRRSYAH